MFPPIRIRGEHMPTPWSGPCRGPVFCVQSLRRSTTPTSCTNSRPSRCRWFRQLLRLRLMPKCQETNWWTTSQFQLVSSMPDLADGSSTDALSAACCASLRASGMYFILRLTQLIVRPDSRLGVLRYKIAPKCLLSGPFGHSGVGGNPGVAGTVSSYNLVFTYPCQSGLFTATKMPESGQRTAAGTARRERSPP